MDIDTIEPGEDFVTVIENAVGSCEILIAIIGRNWLSGTGGTTGRLDNPNDFVRLEIATALRRDIRVVPVLVQRASMPKQQDLPDDVAKFTRRNAVELSDLRWQTDVDQLITVLERVLAKREEARLSTAQAEEEDHQREESETRKLEEARRREAEREREQQVAAEHSAKEENNRKVAEERLRAEAQEPPAKSAPSQPAMETLRAPASERVSFDQLSGAVNQNHQSQSPPSQRLKQRVLLAAGVVAIVFAGALILWLPRGTSPQDSMANTQSSNQSNKANSQVNSSNTPTTANMSMNSNNSANASVSPTPLIDVTGTWYISYGDEKIRFSQKGEVLLVNQLLVKPEDGGPTHWMRVVDGKIKNDKITFCLNQSETVCYKGIVTGNTMKGTSDAGSWTGKRISNIGAQLNVQDAR